MRLYYEPPKKDCLYERIANLMEDDIVSGAFPNQKLPSEQALAERYAASRTVIREALKILGERHLVTTLVGSGAYITKPSAYDLSVVVNRLINAYGINYLDAFDVLIVLETAAAGKAAQNATEEELDELERALEGLCDPALPIEERVQRDFGFHLLIAKLSHNDMLAILTEAVSNILSDIISVGIVSSCNDEDRIRDINHYRIVEALRSRDPMMAQNAMGYHLYSAKLIYNEYIERAAARQSEQATE